MQGLFWKFLFFLSLLPLTLFCVEQNSNDRVKSRANNQVIENSDKNISEQTLSSGKQLNYVPDEVLVNFKPNTDQEVVERIQQKLQLETIRTFSSPNLYLLKITDGSSVETIIKRLQTQEAVKSAEPNFVVKAIN